MYEINEVSARLVELLKRNSLKITAAESCTGGLISAALTSVPGSSGVFDAGFCTYSNDMKIKLLGVDKKTLEKFGAVSRETASEMAEGAAGTTGADIAVSTSGIAGPGGGTPEKPVGTVWTAVKIKDTLHTKLYNFNGCRDEIRNKAVLAVLTDTVGLINEMMVV